MMTELLFFIQLYLDEQVLRSKTDLMVVQYVQLHWFNMITSFAEQKEM